MYDENTARITIRAFLSTDCTRAVNECSKLSTVIYFIGRRRMGLFGHLGHHIPALWPLLLPVLASDALRPFGRDPEVAQGAPEPSKLAAAPSQPRHPRDEIGGAGLSCSIDLMDGIIQCRPGR